MRPILRTSHLIAAMAIAVSFVGYASAAEQSPAKGGSLWVYIGTYTNGGSKGIYVSQLDLTKGTLGPAQLAAEAKNPSFLALHPTKPLLYAVGEEAGPQSGLVSAFSIDGTTGKLSLLNHQLSAGAGPCHIAVDGDGKFVVVANYNGGSVACFPIGADGRLGPRCGFVQHRGSGKDPTRQAGPHAHCVTFSPDNRFVFVSDLGLDKIMAYRLDRKTGQLAPNDPPYAETAPGAGPRHLTFHPNHQYAYAVDELDSTVTAFRYDAKDGILLSIQTISTLPASFKDFNAPAEIEVHPSGQFLYASNRGHGSIAIFSIAADGRLTPLGLEPTQGKNVRSFAIDPTGTYLLAADQDANRVVVYRIDRTSGKLAATGSTLNVAAPVCVVYRRPLPR